MLENIKSVFILEIIFSPINDKIKLKLVKYNKSLQQKINISFMNYKLYSGKYIIYKEKNKGEEYDSFNDLLLFEGEYLNGKRNGKGKEYDFDGNLIFEGEYLNGKRNGKGKEYNDKGEKIFEGEYLNGKRNGKGKEYYDNGNVVLHFEYLNGKKWNGAFYKEKDEEVFYEIKNGKGYMFEANYNGELLFEGEYLNGEKNGKGKEYNNNGKLIYEGEYLNDKRNGKGIEYNYKGEIIFEGEYLYNNKIKGREYIKDDLKKKKIFSFNFFSHDKGRLEYEGEYLYNKKWNGKGYDKDGNIIYDLKNGTGKVKEYVEGNKLIFEGDYLNGKRNGKGIRRRLFKWKKKWKRN